MRLTFLLATSILTSVILRAEETPNLSDEMKAFVPFMGTWHEDVTVRATKRSPRESKMSVLTIRKWALDGKIARAVGTWKPSGPEFIHLWGYDSAAKEYRSWYYDNGGAIPREMISGSWNANNKTMTWNSTDPSGNKVVGSEHAIDNDHFEWTHQVTTPDGELIVNMYGLCTRREE